MPCSVWQGGLDPTWDSPSLPAPPQKAMLHGARQQQLARCELRSLRGSSKRDRTTDFHSRPPLVVASDSLKLTERVFQQARRGSRHGPITDFRPWLRLAAEPNSLVAWGWGTKPAGGLEAGLSWAVLAPCVETCAAYFSEADSRGPCYSSPRHSAQLRGPPPSRTALPHAHRRLAESYHATVPAPCRQAFHGH